MASAISGCACQKMQFASDYLQNLTERHIMYRNFTNIFNHFLSKSVKDELTNGTPRLW